MTKQKKRSLLMLKPNVKKPGIFKRLKGQKFISIPVEGFDHEVIRTSDGKYKAVLKVTEPLNVDLLDVKGIKKAINNIQAALNAHTTAQRLQILITSDEIDVNQYLEELENKAAIKQDVLHKNLLRGKQEYLSDYAFKARNTHNFFLVLESNEKDFGDAMSNLYDLIKIIVEHLQKGGMQAVRLQEEQVKEIIYNRLTPQTHSTQPYETGMDLTTWQPPDIQGGYNVEMDGEQYAFYTLSYFPKSIDAGWLDGIVNTRVNLDISITMEAMDKGDQIDRIDGQIKELSTRLLNKMPTSIKRRYEAEIQSLERLLDKLQDDSENLFNTTFVLGVRASDNEKLKSACKRLETNIKSNRMKAKRITHNSRLMWYMLPIAYKNHDIEKRYGWPMYAELLASMLPFNSSELNQNTGILQGINVKTESPVIYDPWDKTQFNNRNQAVLGESGSGKSTRVKVEILRELYSGKAERQFIIDPEREYSVIPGANCIVFKPGSSFVTNPFHIRSTVVDADDDSAETDGIKEYLPRKISGMMTFFKWIIPDITAYEEAQLFDAIQKAYESVGLVLNEAVDGLPDTFPTLGTLNGILDGMADMGRVQATLKPYVDGVYSRIFNGQTNWTLNSKINVLDIHELDENVRKPLMDLLLKELWEEVKRDRDERVGLIADELWILADERNPQAMQFMHDMAKRIRKYSGFLTVATQNVADILSIGKYGTAIINNCQIKTLMRLSENDVQELSKSEILHLSEGEKEILSGEKPQGYCLHVAKRKRIEMRTIATPKEQEALSLNLAYGHDVKEVV